ncbi:hypothetical protein CTKA_02502 [Chthonomonas calidirosea]|uniref:Uncharacterized protein n=1 Tax=Chthonomonas calidirosea (strain DSM 23976 / ICMP 18418 / T49) TaxID=1303518 RepID=S0EZ28_CHTCT|nr:hypothetical protein [Chthonomonas calidirosea]CCW35414.1 hypothetical protein CCALI_01598 [Chthonomonas calidirosea T49]CEK20347.1 hypothetical protein CTKA_02502 [Chthonomonas calidirosea]
MAQPTHGTASGLQAPAELTTPQEDNKQVALAVVHQKVANELLPVQPSFNASKAYTESTTANTAIPNNVSESRKAEASQAGPSREKLGEYAAAILECATLEEQHQSIKEILGSSVQRYQNQIQQLEQRRQQLYQQIQ